jgi:uncharacterized protein (TIGR02996 family)
MSSQHYFTRQELSLLASIHECPRDQMRFLIYADWLEDRGDPLADFIRVQCQLEGMAADHPEYAALKKRERAALRGHADAWRGFSARRNFWGGFRRGLPVLSWRCWDHEWPGEASFLSYHMRARHGIDLTIFVSDEEELREIFDVPAARWLRRLFLVGPMILGAPGQGHAIGSYSLPALRMLAGLGLEGRLEAFDLETEPPTESGIQWQGIGHYSRPSELLRSLGESVDKA